MPLTRSAIKKLRQDRKKEQNNQTLDNKIKSAIKEVKKDKSIKNVNSAYSFIDKGVKKGLLHKNKASRIKSNISKIVSQNKTDTVSVKTNKNPKKKTVKKSNK